jgi:hypothetical protein
LEITIRRDSGFELPSTAIITCNSKKKERDKIVEDNSNNGIKKNIWSLA